LASEPASEEGATSQMQKERLLIHTGVNDAKQRRARRAALGQR
jgi:hypothetical protein